jgi:DNA repair protein RecO (recombination protein O)
MRVVLEPAFVLHSRPWQDSSLLLNLFTKNHGRISAIAKATRSQKSKQKGLLLPFVPLFISFVGRTDLFTLTKVEAQNFTINFSGARLISGFYLNELLMKLLKDQDSHPLLFESYTVVIEKLSSIDMIEVALRTFEKSLLNEIGYGLEFDSDIAGNRLLPESRYSYQFNHGFVEAISQTDGTISGKSLLALKNNELSEPQILLEVKALMRGIFRYLLAERPLKTAECINQ